jgi:hypothetical protein
MGNFHQARNLWKWAEERGAAFSFTAEIDTSPNSVYGKWDKK